jgi:hypothetical protein
VNDGNSTREPSIRVSSTREPSVIEIDDEDGRKSVDETPEDELSKLNLIFNCFYSSH